MTLLDLQTLEDTAGPPAGHGRGGKTSSRCSKGCGGPTAPPASNLSLLLCNN